MLYLGYMYAGLQSLGWCLCGNDFDMNKNVSSERCDDDCPSEMPKCGEGWSNDVYTTGYMGKGITELSNAGYTVIQ